MATARGAAPVPALNLLKVVAGAADSLCGPPITEVPLSEPDAATLAIVLAALADPIRLRLLSLVAAGGEVQLQPGGPAGQEPADDLASHEGPGLGRADREREARQVDLVAHRAGPAGRAPQSARRGVKR